MICTSKACTWHPSHDTPRLQTPTPVQQVQAAGGTCGHAQSLVQTHTTLSPTLAATLPLSVLSLAQLHAGL